MIDSCIVLYITNRFKRHALADARSRSRGYNKFQFKFVLDIVTAVEA